MTQTTPRTSPAPTTRVTSWRQVASRIDHSILQPTFTDAQMRANLESVRDLPIASVCIKQTAVPLACEVLAGSGIPVGTVVGFPHGSMTTAAKAFETDRAFRDGAREIDMVVNVGKSIGEDWAFVRDDVRTVLDVVNANRGLLKVMFETDWVTDDRHKRKLCEICRDLGVHMVKTSTGFGFVRGDDGKFSYTGATDHDLRLMLDICLPATQVKASGAVRTLERIVTVIEMGCARVGATYTHQMIDAAKAKYPD